MVLLGRSVKRKPHPSQLSCNNLPPSLYTVYAGKSPFADKANVVWGGGLTILSKEVLWLVQTGSPLGSFAGRTLVAKAFVAWTSTRGVLVATGRY